ncbi:MAG: serine/threonine protein kinase [Frankiales bacterium]|nr:MAG: serine/threonine protein kinase [Frankiales bacterium]
MGEVWRADDQLLGRLVAVKTLKPEYLGDDDFRARFRAEARHAGGLSHPGIAAVHDFGEDDECAWLVMELVEGEPLSGLLRRESVLSVDRTLDVVAQTAAALQAAHDGGVVHRDVKPGNLLVRPDGVVKVTDFGIASATDAVPLTRTGHVVGTAYYLSPEQAAGRSGSPASDVYSLGVVAYECLVGARPFPGDNPVAVALAHLQAPPPELPATVPPAVRAMVVRALAKDPADRFASAQELGATALALRERLDGDGLAEVVVAPPAGARSPEADAPTRLVERVPAPRTTFGSPARSSRGAVTTTAALLAVLAVGLGIRSAGPEPVVAAVAAPAPSAVPTPTPVRVTLDPAAHVGKPAVQVRAALAEQGLVPRLSYDGSGTPVGTVSAVEPSGALVLGSAVVLHVVPEPPPVVTAPRAPVVVEQRKAGPPGRDGRNGRGRGSR